MADELITDPFETRHVGPHGAFRLRINREHVRLAIGAVRQRHEDDETRFVARQDGVIVQMRAAA